MTAHSHANISDELLEQAAAWIVQLSADDDTQRAQAQKNFDAWRGRSPEHARAASEMQRVLQQFNHVRVGSDRHPGPAGAAIKAAVSGERSRKIKRVVNTVAVAVALALPAWLLLQNYPPSYLLADAHTVPGQWDTRVLPDGSRLVIGSNSAVNFEFDARRRTLRLVQGDMLVDVAHDASRPFIVETPDGSIRALGTRFVVDRQDDSTVLTMLESRVAVQTASQTAAGSSDGAIVSGGEQVHISARGVTDRQPVNVRDVDDSWKYHLMVARNRPLTEVLDELNRYRRGRILYDREQLRGINMTVALPLDDTDRAIQLLVNSIPGIRARTLTPYLVWVDKPAQK
jgi:transmembrane sensor